MPRGAAAAPVAIARPPTMLDTSTVRTRPPPPRSNRRHDRATSLHAPRSGLSAGDFAAHGAPLRRAESSAGARGRVEAEAAEASDQARAAGAQEVEHGGDDLVLVLGLLRDRLDELEERGVDGLRLVAERPGHCRRMGARCTVDPSCPGRSTNHAWLRRVGRGLELREPVGFS